jgi:ribosome biogenesis protein BRX1
MTDLITLIPHCKKDAKLDTKSDRKVIDEVADMKVSKAGSRLGFGLL